MRNLILSLLGLAATSVSALRVRPGGENLYSRHNVQEAREYHKSIGNVSEMFLTVPINHFTTNNTNRPTY